MSQIIPKQFKDKIKITDIGDFDHGLMDKSLELCFSNQGARTPQGEWQPQTLTVKALIDHFKNFEIGPKDGRALLQGVVQDGHRSKDKMLHADILMLDFDAGYPIETVVEQIKESGFAALIYTTHSHGAKSTTLKQKAIKKALGGGPGNDLDGVKHYLTKEKQWCPDLVNTIQIETVTDEDILITHAPMPKFRVIFFLKERYHFNALSNVKMSRQELWSNRYKAFAETFGIPFDASCSDPSRLMYTPRRPEQSEGHELITIGGASLDFNAIKLPERVKISHQNRSMPKKQLLTKGLERFLGQNSDRFEVLNWIEELDPDLIRHDKKDGSAEIECPFDDNHSNPGDHDDRACWVMNASVSESGHYQFKCLHNSCEDRSPAEFVDAFCDRYEVPIESLKQHLSERVVGPNGETEAETWKLIEGASNQTPSDQIKEICYLVSGFECEIETEKAIKKLSEKTGQNLTIIRNAVDRSNKQRQREQLSIENENQNSYIINSSDGFNLQKEKILNAIEALNADKPHIFSMSGGRLVRVIEEGEHLICSNLDSKALSAELSDLVVFYKFTNQTRQFKQVAPFQDIVSYVEGCAPSPFLYLSQIVQSPIFAQDGTLSTEFGYDPKTQSFLDCEFAIKDIPQKPSVDELKQARELLLEAIEGFPFSDKFDGSEDLEVRIGDKPNYERGVASRAAAVAMILTPFMRTMIKGSTPAFVTDKPKAGTGAGYLVDVAQVIFTGKRAMATPVSKAPDELRKAITSSILSGRNYLFLDNIGHYIDDTSLASAITAGIWSDRILGRSEMTNLDVKLTWIFSANMGHFSHELMRRIVPIRLDAGVDDPTKGRKFKHDNLHDWLENNRADLVWACLLIIQNWIAKGQPDGSVKLVSFTEWSKKLSGVLEAAEIQGFLENLSDYMNSRNTEDDGLYEFIDAWWSKFGNDPVTSSELCSELEQVKNLNISFIANEPSQQAKKLTDFLNQNVLTKTFNLKGGLSACHGGYSPSATLRCKKGKRDNTVTWQLLSIGER